jgi:hypothetical protein
MQLHPSQIVRCDLASTIARIYDPHERGVTRERRAAVTSAA